MLRVESDGPILSITLDRPEVKNAFNAELISALTDAFTGPGKDARVVVVTGAGDAFCAGGDLQWMRQAAGYTVDQNAADALRLANLFQSIVDCPAVVIARVNGACFGGGCGLVAASDVAVCSDKSLFAFSEVKLGVVPATISPFVVPKIGHGHARALFATGEAFGARRAEIIGLVHEVATLEDLDAAVEQKVKAVLASGPKAVAKSKWLAQQSPLSLEAASQLLAATRAGDEAREGISAFLEKRSASFVVKR